MNSFVETYDTSSTSPWFTEPSLLFKTFKGNGTIEITSPSIAFLNIEENNSIIVQTESGTSTFSNVTNLTMNRYKIAHIKTSQINTQEAYGFYTKLEVINPEIILEGDKLTYILVDNRTIEAQTPSIKIMGNITLLVRQPTISINGTMQFRNFYMLHPPTIYTDGRNTTLQGNISLHIYVSDEFSIALPYFLNSPITVKYEPVLIQFNETQSLSLMIPSFIITLIFFTTVVLITRTKQKGEVDTRKISKPRAHN